MNWIREGMRDYTEVTGGGVVTFGRFGKGVKPLVELHGWEKVRPAWRHFLQVTTIQYATPEYFARTYPQWIVKPKGVASPVTYRTVQVGQRLRFEVESPSELPL